MADQNKQHLPYVLYGISTKIYSLFFQKLILIDEEILQSKHLRHYDYECEGLMSIINFLQRKRNKNLILAFQMIKNPYPDLQKDHQFVNIKSLKQLQEKPYKILAEGNITARTKFFTRANTSIQDSDNSFIFSPNIKKKTERNRTQYLNGTLSETGDRSQILHKLLNRVKKVNLDSFQESLKPAKSSYFNLTLGGKPSLQTFQNNCNCNCSCHNLAQNCKKQNKHMKRKKILQKFETIERQIYYQSPIYQRNYITPRPISYGATGYSYGAAGYGNRQKGKSTYSVYQPLTFHQRPKQVVYVAQGAVIQSHSNFIESGLSTSKSVANINYAKKVYI